MERSIVTIALYYSVYHKDSHTQQSCYRSKHIFQPWNEHGKGSNLWLSAMKKMKKLIIVGR